MQRRLLRQRRLQRGGLRQRRVQLRLQLARAAGAFKRRLDGLAQVGAGGVDLRRRAARVP
jgi:hypothetical protein